MEVDLVSQTQPAWVVLVTGGTVVEYPPELYLDRERGEEEAERWAWILSGAGWVDVKRPFVGRWQVNDRWVRLVEISLPSSASLEELWIGTYWDRDGNPDPEARILRGRAAAKKWVDMPPFDYASPAYFEARPWYMA